MKRSFDLKKALAGAKIVTRDGRSVLDLHYFELISLIYVLLEDSPYPITYFQNGAYSSSSSNLDLFMEEGFQTVWVNVYKALTGELILGEPYETRLLATHYISHDIQNRIYIKTVSITEDVEED